MQLHIIPQFNDFNNYEKLAAEQSLKFEYNDFFLPELLDDTAELERRIAFYARLNRSGDTLHGAFLDISFSSAEPSIRALSLQRARQSLDIAAGLNCRAVIFHGNINPWICTSSYVEDWVSANVAAYRTLAQEYPNIEILVENMFDDNPTALRRLMSGLEGTGVGICLDVAHAAISSTPIEEWFKALSPYVKHLHLNDNDLHSDGHLAIGEGKIDYENVFSLIRRYPVPSALIEVGDFGKTAKSLAAVRGKL